MYKVILAEDEPLVRMGIRSMVDWAGMDMSLAEDCRNGQEAWDAYCREKPDLVITDLRMPVMDGISLIRRIREKDRRTRIVILTCIEDFDCAREAVELGVTSYVMKLSCSVEKLENILGRAKAELAAYGAEAEGPAQVDCRPIREQLFFDYVRYRAVSRDDFADGVERLSMPVPSARLSLVILRLVEYGRFLESDPSGRRLSALVADLVRQAMVGEANWDCYYDHPGEYVLLMSCPDADAEGRRDEALLRVSELLDEHLNLDARFSPGDVGMGYEALPAMYKAARERLDESPEQDCPRKVAAAMAIIRKGYDKPISLQSAADTLEVSTGYLSRLFIRHMGATFTDALNRTRVERARQLLDEGALPAYQVGQLVGIHNATYFIRVFKKYAGMTPNEYRNAHA